jgi:hypothetical protein
MSLAPDFEMMMYCCLAVSVIALFLVLARGNIFLFLKDLNNIQTILITAVASYCVFGPGRPSTYYLPTIIFPSVLLCTQLLVYALRFGTLSNDRNLTAGLVAMSLIYTTPLYYRRVITPDPFPYIPIKELDESQDSRVTRLILDHAKPGEKLAIWGWSPQFYTLTGLSMGTRDAICLYTIRKNPMLDYFRNRYLSDIKANRPEIILEAVGSGYSYPNRVTEGIATFKELNEFIQSGYKLVESNEEVQIFRRKN